MNKTLLISLLFFIPISLFAQPTQTVRGTVVDKITKAPLFGANIILVNSPSKGASTTQDGKFRIEQVAAGRQMIKVSYIGYQEMLIPVVVYSGKELVLNIEMEESVLTQNEVVIKGTSNGKSNNEMSNVSVRKFSVEEAYRYAGSLADPARMAMNFAGVNGADDLHNDIVIRGNSPAGLLWRMEDVDIPNPNHFASQGSTGGPISMLNNNSLASSDFSTGAFPAEYSNALSGVFDLKLRTGNNEKHEYIAQIGILGFEFGAEGPFTSKKKSSYAFNYRYSTMDVVDKVINLKINGIPRYTDMAFKLNFPLKKGNIACFGLAGSGSMKLLDSKEDTNDFTANPTKENLYFGSDMATSGISYTWISGAKTYHKFILSGYFQKIRNKLDTLGNNDVVFNVYHDFSADKKVSFRYMINKKINSKLSQKSGLTFDKLFFNLESKEWEESLHAYRIIINEKKNIEQGPFEITAYTQWLYKPNSHISIRAGVNGVWFGLNNHYVVEPRAGITCKINPVSNLNLGYGLHSRTQPLISYYSESMTSTGNYLQTNKNLDFTKAHHLVLSYDRHLNENVKLKSEAYYQSVFNVPVEQISSSFSMVNTNIMNGEYSELIHDSLVNQGTGFNYGLEFTLERFFSKNYYYMMAVSVFNSKYRGSDGILRNTEFNNNYIFNTLVGKEFKIRENRIVFVNLRGVYAGGRRYTPFDLDSSIKMGYGIRSTNLAYSGQFSPYYRFDLKAGGRFDFKKASHEFAISLDNFTNHQNVFRQVYNNATKSIKTDLQFGIIPGVYYRIYF